MIADAQQRLMALQGGISFLQENLKNFQQVLETLIQGHNNLLSRVQALEPKEETDPPTPPTE